MGFVQGRFQKAVCGLLLWHCLDVCSAHGDSVDLFSGFPDWAQKRASDSGSSICAVAGAGDCAMVFFQRNFELHYQLPAVISLSSEKGGFSGRDSADYQAAFLSAGSQLFCFDHVIDVWDLSVECILYLGAACVLFFCRLFAGFRHWLFYLSSKCVF